MKREQLLNRLSAAQFAMWETHVYLDTHKGNAEAQRLFRKYKMQFEKLKNDITVKARRFSSVEYIAAEIQEEPEDLYFSTPETVRRDIIDIIDVVNHKENKTGIRYVISREFTQEERDALKALSRQYPDKIFIPASPAFYCYAPEIKHDYFIILD